MFAKKIRVTWLYVSILLTVALMVAGFAYFNLRVNLEKYNFPVTGLRSAPKFIYTIKGNKQGELLDNPLAAAVGKTKLYVADSQNHRISIYDKKGNFVNSFGSIGSGNNQFIYPNAIAVDNNQNVYVGEFQNARIQIFDADGKFLKIFKGDNKTKLFPLSLTVSQGKIYVANRSGEVIILDSNGKVLTKFGTPGTALGSFNYPNGIAISPKGDIVVSDSGNSRIQVFSPDGKFLQLVNLKAQELSLPRGIGFDQLGQLYVVDTFNHHVLVLNSNYKYLYTFGDRGMEDGQFDFPNTVSIDEDFKIYVTDRENNRIEVFQYR